MAEVVFVHGMGPIDQSADELLADWRTALAATLRREGEPALAERLEGGATDLAMAYYRHLFRPHDPADQWDVRLSGDQARTATDIGVGLLGGIEEHATRDRDRAEAARELAAFRADLGPAQGPPELLRLAVGGLARCGAVARAGFAAAKTVLLRNLSQVAAYLDDEDVRERAVAAVLDHVDADTRAVYAHSLGSVVAYEALHRLEHPLPLLVTFGSPLGLRTIVRERLRPQPPRVPPTVKRWVNLADRDDFVVALLHLDKVFGDATGVLEPTVKVANRGLDAHAAVKYLGQAPAAAPLAEVLRTG
ncbi:hypothetical protein [Kitasatospora purpeofusca]|uniref:hypothetical protein n=1 Tax=Kitasatospora purpeofusca TaxID=67352 RepID=UPI0036D32EB6